MSTQAYFNMNKKIVTILCIKSSLIWTYDNEPFLRNAILIEHLVVYTSGIENCLEIGKDHNFNIQREDISLRQTH